MCAPGAPLLRSSCADGLAFISVCWCVLCNRSRVATVRFGYGLGMERFGRFRFSVRPVALVPVVPVLLSVESRESAIRDLSRSASEHR